MGDSGQAPALTAAFPDPPPYFKYFTADNLTVRQRELDGNDGTFDNEHDSDEGAARQADLRFLSPPDPPEDGKWRSFGVQHDLSQPELSLEKAGITQIYPTAPPSVDPTPRLITLTRAIIVNFLELVGIMSNSPEESTEKIEDLQTLFYNVHDMLNQYRPHQARESLIMMLQDHLDRSRNEMQQVADEREKLDQLMQSIASTGQKAQEIAAAEISSATAGGTNTGITTKSEQERKERQRDMWQMLEAELG